MQVFQKKVYREKYEIPLDWVRLEPTPATRFMEQYYAWFLWMTRRIGYVFGALAHFKHNTVPWNLFFNKRSGAVVMSPDSDGLGAAVVAGVGSSLTQSSGISYFSLYTFFWNTCISIDPGQEFFVEVCLNLKL